MEPERDPRVGTVLQDRYRIGTRIAAGGMGVVYQGERIGLGRKVAIKFLHAWIVNEPAIQRRFETEARAMSRLAHPNCAAVIDSGLDAEGVPFLVMEYVAGRTLRSMIEGGRLPPGEAVDIARQILAGLAHAHGENIVHRDMKPENVIVSEAIGFPRHVRILDFGLAKLRDATGASTVGFAVGTPSYMAPEQTVGGAVDPRTDVYAVGVLLFECLTGRKPFVGETALDVIRKHRLEPPPRIADVAPELAISPALEAAIACALAKTPADRHPTAADFAEALDRTPELLASRVRPAAASPPASAPAAAVPAPPARHRRRRIFLFAGVAAAALTATVVAIAVTTGGDGDDRAAPPPSDDLLLVQPYDVDDAEIVIAPEDERLGTARRLVEQGRIDPAIKLLVKLRAKSPDDAEVAYLLGHAYFTKLWWNDGLTAYRAAITLDPSYRTDPTLIRDLVRSLMSDKFHATASSFIIKEIGPAALPHLDDAAEHSPAIGTRRRARSLADRLRASSN